MNLEDMPEMQLLVSDYACKGFYRSFQKDKDGTFSGKFVLFKAVPKDMYCAPALQTFIYSEKGATSHLDIAPHFIEAAYNKYKFHQDTVIFVPVGGGMVEVTETQMIFSGESVSCGGKYDLDKTKEIAQRFCEQNRLNLEILLK